MTCLSPPSTFRTCVASVRFAPGTVTRAFSLIEVLIAIVVLAIGLLGLGAVFPVVVNQQRQVADTVQGVSIERSVAEMLKGNQLLTQRGDPGDIIINGAERRGWQMVLAEPTWSEVDQKFPDGLWELPEAGDVTAVVDAMAYEPNTGRVGVSGGSVYGVVIPVTERLIPRPYSTDTTGSGSNSEPRYVWDFAARRIGTGERLLGLAVETDQVRDAKLLDDNVQLAIFVRRIDPGIRRPSGATMSDVLTGRNLTDPDSQMRLPVAVDADGRPTLDGLGIRNRPNYSPILRIRYEVADTVMGGGVDPRDVRLDRIVVDESLVGEQIAETIPLRPFLEQAGQMFVDERGVVHTVKDVDSTNGGAGGRTVRVLIIDPPMPRDLLALNGADRNRLEILFTPQIPASINVVIVD